MTDRRQGKLAASFARQELRKRQFSGVATSVSCCRIRYRMRDLRHPISTSTENKSKNVPAAYTQNQQKVSNQAIKTNLALAVLSSGVLPDGSSKRDLKYIQSQDLTDHGVKRGCQQVENHTGPYKSPMTVKERGVGTTFRLQSA